MLYFDRRLGSPDAICDSIKQNPITFTTIPDGICFRTTQLFVLFVAWPPGPSPLTNCSSNSASLSSRRFKEFFFLAAWSKGRLGRESCCFLRTHPAHDGVCTFLSKNAKWNKPGTFIQKPGQGFSATKPGMEWDRSLPWESLFKMSYFSCTYWALFQYSDLFSRLSDLVSFALKYLPCWIEFWFSM